MPNVEKDLELEKLKGDPNMWMRLTMLSEDGTTMKSVFTDKENPFIKNSAGAMDKIQSLAKLPTREVLLANVLGAFQAPIASFARAVQAIVDKGGVEACMAAADEAAPAEEAAE